MAENQCGLQDAAAVDTLPNPQRVARLEAGSSPTADVRGRWWFLANPDIQTMSRGGFMPGDNPLLVGPGRYDERGLLLPPKQILFTPLHFSIGPPVGTRYQEVYLASLPIESHSQGQQPQGQQPDVNALDSLGLKRLKLQNISQSYDDLFTAMNEVPLLSLDLGMPVRIILWVEPPFVMDKAGVLRLPADLEQHPDLGVWDQGSLLDTLLRWFFWWSPETIAADWSPNKTRIWLERNGGITPEDEARLIQMAERIGLGEVAAGRAYRCANPRCLDPVPKDEAIKIMVVSDRWYPYFSHERCLWASDRERWEHQKAKDRERGEGRG